jgi:hypothetical protein
VRSDDDNDDEVDEENAVHDALFLQQIVLLRALQTPWWQWSLRSQTHSRNRFTRSDSQTFLHVAVWLFAATRNGTLNNRIYSNTFMIFCFWMSFPVKGF